MRRFATLTLLILTAVLAQTTIFAEVKLFGVAPDLVLVLVICFSLLQGPTSGAVAGFASGLLRDLLSNGPKGLTGLAYLIVGYVTGSVRPYVESTSVFVPMGAVLGGTLAASAMNQMLEGLLGQHTVPVGRLIQVILLMSIYNTLLVPFVYPVVRRFSQQDRQKKVYHW